MLSFFMSLLFFWYFLFVFSHILMILCTHLLLVVHFDYFWLVTVSVSGSHFFTCMYIVGGPLGELVQWSDIITALYLLGHEITVTSEVEQLAAYVFKLLSHHLSHIPHHYVISKLLVLVVVWVMMIATKQYTLKGITWEFDF